MVHNRLAHLVQRSAKVLVRGLVKFVPALASVSFHCTMVPFWGEVKGGPTWFGSAGNTPHTDSVGTPC